MSTAQDSPKRQKT